MNIAKKYLTDVWPDCPTTFSAAAASYKTLTCNDLGIPYNSIVAVNWIWYISSLTSFEGRMQLHSMFVDSSGNYISNPNGTMSLNKQGTGEVSSANPYYLVAPGTAPATAAHYSGGALVPISPGGLVLRVYCDTGGTVSGEHELSIWYLKD